MIQNKAAVSLTSPRQMGDIPDPVMELMLAFPVVVAPIEATRGVLGLLYVSEPPLWLHTLQPFPTHVAHVAAALGRICERELLYDRFRSQRSRVRAALNEAELSMASFDTEVALVQLVGRDQADPRSPARLPLHDLRATWAEGLTKRERDVMQLLFAGHDNSDIAVQLAISPNTVKSHVRHILGKVNAANRAELISRYYGLM